jgi:hypothetical protein
VWIQGRDRAQAHNLCAMRTFPTFPHFIGVGRDWSDRQDIYGAELLFFFPSSLILRPPSTPSFHIQHLFGNISICPKSPLNLLSLPQLLMLIPPSLPHPWITSALPLLMARYHHQKVKVMLVSNCCTIRQRF